jgi:hypothetical protein
MKKTPIQSMSDLCAKIINLNLFYVEDENMGDATDDKLETMDRNDLITLCWYLKRVEVDAYITRSTIKRFLRKTQ